VSSFTVAVPPRRGEHAAAAASAAVPGDWRDLPLYEHTENGLAMLLRYALYYGHLRWGNTRAMRLVFDGPIQGSSRGRALRHLAKLLSALLASRRRLLALENLYFRLVARSSTTAEYARIFAEDRPDYLLASHQRPPSTAPPVIAARRYGIPTGSQIFSWDNLTSKGRIAAPFDTYLVWSDLMRSELLRFYPETPARNVHLVGAPQFDPYADSSLLQSREEFLGSLGLDPTKQVICYSGGDLGTCPEDPQHLALLLELIDDGSIPGTPQVVVRPAPVDDISRYATVRQRFPEVVFSPPRWSTGEGWQHFLPSAEDVRLLANLTQHCDLNVNTASTMSLDFAIHDRPVVNLAIDMHDPPLYGGPLRDVYYQFEHYKRVVDSGAVRVAANREDLARHVTDYLSHPELDREERAALVALQVGRPIGSACASVLDACQAIAAEWKTSRQ
jgi:hypothetical protein